MRTTALIEVELVPQLDGACGSIAVEAAEVEPPRRKRRHR